MRIKPIKNLVQSTTMFYTWSLAIFIYDPLLFVLNFNIVKNVDNSTP